MCQATYDHVKPLQLGGQSSVGNLVATCKACNYGKGKFSLKELGLNRPREWQIIADDWHGLADLLNSKKS
jgi:5-methylcytosine-specific restriction endonuclease McrA